MNPLTTHEIYMTRCLQLAKNGKGYVDPNPLVGSVVVHNNSIIGEGFHAKFGEAHAEVHAINSVKDKTVLPQSTLYVTLEPCAHFGKTPPCSDLIIHHKIPIVVIGMQDPFSKVDGAGIKKLIKAGIEVITGVLTEECQNLNRSFITYHSKNRPYVILKWAETQDGFIDNKRGGNSNVAPTWITNDTCRLLVHKWRSEIPAIMVGKNTALFDNPKLDNRFWSGRSPLRIVTDRELNLPKNLYLFDNSVPTIILNETLNDKIGNREYVKTDFQSNFPENVLHLLYTKGINSLLVEGGRKLLDTFIQKNCWDEARIFVGNKSFGQGLSAPTIRGLNIGKECIGDSQLSIILNR
jgi:diaminohydroxyphosphoribosylaminopyrimidine deaminase/5-amino-6-(5-phosphoribosylamino)uracil reductase